MAAQTQVKVSLENQLAVLEIEGDLNSAAGPAIEAAYREAVQGHDKLLLSFREQDIINSAGIAHLIDLVSQSQRNDVALRIAHPSAHFRRILDMVGLTQHVPILATVAEARQDF